MSEPVAKQRPMIDLDEFERRLRRPTPVPQPRNEDPLAELARLVGEGNDPYENMFQERPGAQQPRPMTAAERIASRAEKLSTPERGFNAQRPRVAPPPLPSAAPTQSAQTAGPRGLPRVEPDIEPLESWPLQPSVPQPSVQPPRGQGRSQQNLGGNFAAIEAGLRGSIQPEFRSSLQPEFRSPAPKFAPASAPQYDPRQQQPYEAHAPEDEDDDWLNEAQLAAPQRPAETMPELPRSRRLLYLTGAIILIGVGGIGATFAIKRSVPSPQQIAMIKASTIPAKVEAPAPAPGDGAKIIQDASVLDKTPQPMPRAVVNRTEQPVNVAQAEASAVKTGGQGAASVPVPPPPTANAAGDSTVSLSEPWRQGTSGPAAVADAAPSRSANQSLSLGIEPRKVKTVAVRPDGTIISDNAPAPTPPTGPSATSAKPTPSAEAKPKDDARAAPSGVGAAERQALAGRNTTPPAGETSAEPKSTVQAKPVRVASIDHARHDGITADSASGFSVQVAAPATQAEALVAISRLQRRYASELQGRRLKWHHAKVGTKSVYRVRVGSLSKAEAVKLCEALKAKGGSCFVAHD